MIGVRGFARCSCWPFVVLLVALPLRSGAQEAADADYEKERQVLLGLKDLYQQAVSEDRASLLEPHVHENFSAVMVTGEQVSDFASLDAYWEKMKELMGEGGKIRLDIVPAEKVRIFGDLAFAHGTTDNTVTTGAGREYRFEGRWTALCQKQGGEWKILRIHDSMNDPVGNEFVAATVRAASLASGAVGGVAGIVLASVVCLFWRRRKG